MANELKDVIQPKSASSNEEKLNLELDLTDLTAANTTNKDSILTAIATLQTDLQEDLQTKYDAMVLDAKTKYDDINDRITIMDTKFSKVLGYGTAEALDTANEDSVIVDLNTRLTDLDTKFSKVLGYSTSRTYDTPAAESVKAYNTEIQDRIGDVSTLTGTSDGLQTDALTNLSLTGVMQTINDKIGDVSTLTNPVVVDNVTADEGEDLETQTLTGIHQELNNKVGVPEEITVLVGEMVDATTGVIVSPGVEITLPKSLSGHNKANFLSSQESWQVEKDLRKRFMNLINPFMEAFNKLIDALLQISPVSPRL